MSIYLGTYGHVELRRNAPEQALLTTLEPDDVNVDRRRFSVDFAEGALISGDQITIATQGGSPLKLIADHTDSNGDYYQDWRGYVYVDDAGGLRLYDTFDGALSGSRDRALPLVTPDTPVAIGIQTRDVNYNCLAQVRNYEITTSRDQVNTDVLGQEFHTYYEAGLISGQGRLNCFWEHTNDQTADCGERYDLSVEFSSYLARLVLRLKQGAGFDGRFYIYAEDNNPAVWYECQCIVSNVAVSVAPTQIITTDIDFLCTGPITLRQGQPPRYLLQEDSSLLLQEDGSPILLQDED